MCKHFRADVNALRKYGSEDFSQLADNFSSASRSIQKLAMDPAIFGAGCEAAEVVTAQYGTVQRALADATQHLSETLDEIGLALVRIANNYTAVDEHYGN